MVEEGCERMEEEEEEVESELGPVGGGEGAERGWKW